MIKNTLTVLAIIVATGLLLWFGLYWEAKRFDAHMDDYIEQHRHMILDGVILVNDWSAIGEPNEQMQQWFRMMIDSTGPLGVWKDTFFVYRVR